MKVLDYRILKQITKILINTTTQLHLHIVNVQRASQLFGSKFQLQKLLPGLRNAKNNC